MYWRKSHSFRVEWNYLRGVERDPKKNLSGQSRKISENPKSFCLLIKGTIVQVQWLLFFGLRSAIKLPRFWKLLHVKMFTVKENETIEENSFLCGFYLDLPCIRSWMQKHSAKTWGNFVRSCICSKITFSYMTIEFSSAELVFSFYKWLLYIERKKRIMTFPQAFNSFKRFIPDYPSFFSFLFFSHNIQRGWVCARFLVSENGDNDNDGWWKCPKFDDEGRINPSDKKQST